MLFKIDYLGLTSGVSVYTSTTQHMIEVHVKIGWIVVICDRSACKNDMVEVHKK